MLGLPPVKGLCAVVGGDTSGRSYFSFAVGNEIAPENRAAAERHGVRHFFVIRPERPAWRISRSIRLRPIRSPSSTLRSDQIRGEP
jgi:hypothetical protein